MIVFFNRDRENELPPTIVLREVGATELTDFAILEFLSYGLRLISR